MNYSVCGIDCDSCKFKNEQNCKGCRQIEGKVFWVIVNCIGAMLKNHRIIAVSASNSLVIN